jgi:hypothetical protein
MSVKRYHFALTEAQAVALIDAVGGVENSLKRNSPLDNASIALDEQMASQDRAWEKCATCGGSGWVEDGA